MKITKIATTLAMPILISGCGLSEFSIRQTNPLLSDYQGILTPWTQSISTMAPDASRRVTIMRLSNADNNYNSEKWSAGEFCSEPPPDAMVNTASLFELITKIKGTDSGATGATAEGSGQINQQIASIMSPLLRRSQGLQWSRDNLSFVCNAHLNRTISKAEYIKLVEDIIKRSDGMIRAEIEHLPIFEWKVTGAAPNEAPALLAPTH